GMRTVRTVTPKQRIASVRTVMPKRRIARVRTATSQRRLGARGRDSRRRRSPVVQRERMNAHVRGLVPRLPGAVWALQAGGLANAFGSGVVVPFVIIYLHDVRGISLTVAGLAASASALGAIPASAAAGALADRFGARRVLSGTLLAEAVAIACFPGIRAGWHAVALELALGAGSGAFWPAQA